MRTHSSYGRRRLVAFLAVTCVIGQWAFGWAVPAVAQAPPRPKLVVLLVVDQMRADYVDRFRHQWTGGLKRLIDRGAWFHLAAYPYLNTVTCVGHATIATGAFPSTHGMVLNGWWDRETGRTVSCTDDAQASIVSYGGGAAAEGGHSAARLRVPTLADELRIQSSERPRIVSLSMKARSAIMPAGRRADAIAWFADTGAWVTSSAYSAERIPFIDQFIKANPVERDLGKQWTRTLPETSYLYADNAPGEPAPQNWTNVFPHALGRSGTADAGFYRNWQQSPFADDYLGRLAAASIEALHLGKGPGTDFLNVSFSALDVVGHTFGPRSQEVQDVLVRLDITIGQLLATLDRAVGPDQYVLALSADHGVSPIPEQLSQEGIDAGRISNRDMAAKVDEAIAAILGPGKYGAASLFTDFYFAPGVYDKLLANPEAMKAAINALATTPGVARVFRGEELRIAPPPGDPIARAAALSYFPGRSGDLVVVPRPYWQYSGAGTTHGTANAYDQRVPVLLFGSGIRPGEYLQTASPADIAPTLAFLCGITLSRADGRVLSEALAQGPAAARR